MNSFAVWLYTTAPSAFIRNHESWMIPAIQSLHILSIATAVSSALLTTLRVAGWMGVDQTVLQTQRRYGPWLAGALWMLLLTGSLLVLAEPPRDLDTVSFWLKMALVLVMALLAAAFGGAARRLGPTWTPGAGVKVAALASLLLWVAIILLGRFIAYDQIWGRLLHGTKA